MCRRAVERFGNDPDIRALILSPIEYGVTRYTHRFAGPVHIDEDTLHAMVTGVCRSIIRMSFSYIVIVNNHFEPEHIQTLHRSIDSIANEIGVQVGYLDLTRRDRAARLTEEFRRWGAHAGQYETSMVLADQPEQVKQDVMRSLPDIPISLVDAIGAGLKDFKAMGLTQAYNGSPAQSTAEEGLQSFDVLTDMLVEVILELAHGTGGRDLPGFYNRTGGGPAKGPADTF
jgi:creatinine amidohydrolase